MIIVLDDVVDFNSTFQSDSMKILDEIDQPNINESLILSPDPEDETSIGMIAELIAQEFDYLDKLRYDTSKSDGQYRKTADNDRIKKLYGELNLMEISDGIKRTVRWFRENYDQSRK